MSPRDLDKPVSIYRVFDAEGVLLYVGQSSSPLSRLDEHKRLQVWQMQIASVTVEWHATREDALAAEKEAIREEGPVWNYHHLLSGRLKKLGIFCPEVDVRDPDTWGASCVTAQGGRG
ncbi:GIY-YIG nuclease family protein [Ruegeria sp. HKCCD6109]|uniref:GIY-YIG nuclease family protein n=1 Tax=Ruegeria sp. HKCCD6109 TaxID=2683017 RepID=UPI001492B86E|nr:GIY-YIG nuclease family protein [Ruegeria sp. HKCCD6109]NOD65791.1 GIY-YIG nuclease family protein [Ruegeria sp. HKCCD6109]